MGRAAEDAEEAYSSNPASKYIKLSNSNALTEAQLDDMNTPDRIIEVPGGARTMRWWKGRKRELDAQTVVMRAAPKKKQQAPKGGSPLDQLSDGLSNLFK